MILTQEVLFYALRNTGNVSKFRLLRHKVTPCLLVRLQASSNLRFFISTLGIVRINEIKFLANS